MYQMLDEGFIGLIFSVFNSAPSKEQTIQATAFQSLPGGDPAAAGLQGVSSGDLAGLDLQTQEALRASAAGTLLCVVRAARQQHSSSSHASILQYTRVSCESDISSCGCGSLKQVSEAAALALPYVVAEHMQEASSGSSWHRKEVPLAVLQDGSNPSTLSDYGEHCIQLQAGCCIRVLHPFVIQPTTVSSQCMCCSFAQLCHHAVAPAHTAWLTTRSNTQFQSVWHADPHWATSATAQLFDCC
jgi:hypothetical protein